LNSIFLKFYPIFIIILIINLRNTVADIFIPGVTSIDYAIILRASLFVLLGAISYYRLLKSKININEVEVLFLIYLAYCFLSTLYSGSPISTFVACFELAVLYLMIKDFSITYGKFSFLMMAQQHSYFIIFVAIVLFFQVDFLTSLNTESFTSVYSTEIAAQTYAPLVFLKNNPSKMASIALMAFIFFFFSKKKSLLILPMLYMIVLAQSRTIFFTSLLMILFYFFGNRYKTFIIFLLASFVMLVFNFEEIFTLFFQSSYLSRGEELSYFLEGNARFELWEKSIEYTLESPIFGIGFNNSPFLEDPQFYFTKGSHSFYLSLLLYNGIIGFLGFAYMVFKLIKNILKIRSDEIRNIFLAILLSTFINGLVGDELSSSRPIYMTYFIYIIINYDQYRYKNKLLENYI
tara:strand:+ start:612 stop:1826 length:1215 start_codon:yes stop_codon:yes gene_type:complete